MIVGIGVDIVEIERIEVAMKKQPRFLERILAAEERLAYQEIANDQRKLEWLSGRFAAKEALSKALGTGIGVALSFQDISILNAESGIPEIKCDKLTNTKAHVSISHERKYAIAQVVLEKM